MKKKRKPKEKWANAGARKYKEENFDMTPPDVGTFAWLDKELTKIEKEKLRLEREKSKFEERQARYNSFNTANINIFFQADCNEGSFVSSAKERNHCKN